MTQTAHMMAAGLSPQASRTIQGGLYNEGGLTATGSTRSTSLLLPASKNYISLCSSGKGVALPICNQGDDIDVYNGGLNTLAVYTNSTTSETITNNSAGGSFSIATMRAARFSKVTGTLWMVNYSA